ncbi:MAG: hypothetical protein HOD92_04915 [Deltaproteobacteria bacterium]|jgi:hypothetical protein|nr:hypothetical protein [Deltaproteobacteria bacterium]MBT4525132.1 hypothetical protein [Deltaproteobacteria bacterium]
MNALRLDDLGLPIKFKTIFKKTFLLYRSHFLSVISLSALAYLPFLLLEPFTDDPQFVVFVETLHGCFLDVIIFLTLPTIFIHKKIFPIATLQIFFQRFFASSVIISVVQFFALIVIGIMIFMKLAISVLAIGTQAAGGIPFLIIFIPISIAILVVGFIPYIKLIFSGFFLILGNETKLIDVKRNLLSSIQLLKTSLFPVLIAIFKITILISIPVFIFMNWYLMNHPEVTALIKSFDTQQPAMGEKMIETQLEMINIVFKILQEPNFAIGRILIHCLVRPIKSIFLCILFLSLMMRFNPDSIKSYFSIQTPDTTEVEETED